MNICVLTSTYHGSQSPFADYDSDQFNIEEHLQDHRWVLEPLEKQTSAMKVKELSGRGFDLFMNLCDGAADEDRAGIEVVEALECENVPYTGADPSFYEPTREMMKEACATVGLLTPLHRLARSGEDIDWAAEHLRFPLFVKHHNSYGSIGTSRESRVETPGQLQIQAKKIIASYGGALIEEFIEGREFTVLVVENAENPGDPFAYPPLELKFPPGETFNHFGMKWSDETIDIEFKTVHDSSLTGRLGDTGKQFFIAMKGTGYGRCDMRMDRKGDIYVLEINPNCTLFGPQEPPNVLSADYMIMNDRAGYSGFIDRIFSAACKRIK